MTDRYHTFDHAHAILHARAQGGKISTSRVKRGQAIGIGVDVHELATMTQNFLNQYIEASLKASARGHGPPGVLLST